MNPITDFFLSHLLFVYFCYGLAFFSLGLALQVAGRQSSTFRFALAIGPLAAFGYLHGAHEWFEMFQMVVHDGSSAPSVGEELVRLVLLVGSFKALLIFGALLLNNGERPVRRVLSVLIPLLLWAGALAVVWLAMRPTALELIAMADVLSRYLLAIPGALLAAWALMAQQRAFREQDFSRFGQDLVWCAAALLLYGVVGQIFVRSTALPPSTVLNSDLFLAWFGIPVQLFRTVMAGFLTFFMVRALRVFQEEGRRQLEEAHRIRYAAQEQALEAERRSLAEITRLNQELRLTARELALLVEMANLLVLPMQLEQRLAAVMEKIVANLHFADAGLILLIQPESGAVRTVAATGFADTDADHADSRYALTLSLGRESIASGDALCRHEDGEVLHMSAELTLLEQICRAYASPTLHISLPLVAEERVIGSLALARVKDASTRLEVDDLQLIIGIAQQLGLSTENARLSQQAQVREQRLADLLQRIVEAQEGERSRIARELHDATGQALTAIALGLRGVQALLQGGGRVLPAQFRELEGFATTALKELHQIITDLRPPQLDDLGLQAAVRWYLQEFGRRLTLETSLVIEGENRPVPPEYEIVIFRIVQEALTNVAKHARAEAVTVTLHYDPARIRVEVLDDGCGFDPEELNGKEPRGGWGLLGIRERTHLLGGVSGIDSAPGRGARLHVEIPLPDESLHAAAGGPLSMSRAENPVTEDNEDA